MAETTNQLKTSIDPHMVIRHGFFERWFNAILVPIFTRAKTRLDGLERRVEALEQRPPSPEYRGVYADGAYYDRGSLVTRSGGLWLALEDTLTCPGHSDAWRLVVKKGEA